jgi:DNA-binding NarL/FixJ family response regulator
VPTPIRVLVADDHPVFRSGLRRLVEESDGLELAGEAADGEQAVAACSELRPDVVLMDIRMPGLSGIDATRRILAVHPSIGILMLTMLEDDTSVFAAIRAGAKGYVLKGAAPEDIIRAITAVAAGEMILGASLADRARDLFQPGLREASRPFPALSTREHDILNLVAAGLSNGAIADKLVLSEKTVRNNVSNIFAKLLVADRPAAIVRAREAGLGAPP